MLDLLATSPDMCKDIAWGWILTLFGTEGTGCTNILGAADVNTPYANAFSVLTTSLSFLGSLFLAYHVVVGIVSTAYTGKVLGERWHQIYAPLRVVLGFGLLVPMPGGFSAVHYILRDVVGLIAVNLGNAVIGTYIQTAFDPQKDYVQSQVQTLSGIDVATKFFDAELCTGVVATLPSQGYLWWKMEGESPEEGQPTGDDGYTWDYGSCGNVNLPLVKTNASEGVFSLHEVKTLIDDFNKNRYEATEELRKEVKALTDYKALGNYINKHSDSIETSSEAVVAALRDKEIVSPAIQQNLEAAANKWNAAVGEAATHIFAEASKGGRAGAISSIDEYGFMAAGAYERSLSATSSVVSGMANGSVSSSDPNVDESTAAKIAFARNVIATNKAVDNKNNSDASPSSSSGVIKKLLTAIFPENLAHMGAGTQSADPVGDMIMFGNTLLTAAGYAILTLVAIKSAGFIGSVVAGAMAGGGIPGAVAGGAFGIVAGEVVAAIAPWVVPVIIMMVLIGLMHSFVLPMIPMIMVFIMGVSWLLMFLEGAIAAVLWAFVFIRMDGNELMDSKQAPGVSLLFNLLLRPALGMLAFAGMILLLPALLNALNQIWGMAFRLQTGEHSWLSLVWAYQWLAQAVLFCWMQWTITLRLASLIPQIADRVGHWMGMGQSSGYSDSLETGAAVAGLVAATRAVDGGIKGTVGNLTRQRQGPSVGQKIAEARHAREAGGE